MTTRDRQNDLDDDARPVTWDERAIAGSGRGLPWWSAIALGLGLAVVGAAIDLQVQGKLGLLFKACYFVGCVGAVCAVRRGNLFAPMVQPPLVLAVTVPGVVLAASGLPDDADTLARILAIGNPLINGFPTMAVTTAVTVAIGVVRIIRERDPEAAGKRAMRAAPEPKGSGRSPRPAGSASRGAPPAAGRRRADPPPAATRRTSAEQKRARPLEPREPGTSTALPGTRRPAGERGNPLPKRDGGPGGRRRADDPSLPRPMPRRTEGELPRRPIREGTPPPRRLPPQPGEQPRPQRRRQPPTPPAGKRPWEIEDR